MSKLLTIIKNPTTGCELPTPLAMELAYTPDPFQQHSIAAIHKEHNLLVTAKTGSGKTFVGEYQIAYSLKKCKRVFYTTPIKSLSNQKFYDLKKMFGEDNVGIMTGDIKFQPSAPIVIMTTEILQNLLFKRDATTKHLGISAQLTIDDLDAVVFDEIHYFNKKQRGKVWEKTLVLLPPSVKIVGLSATIATPERFAGWIAKLKKQPMDLITTAHRVVPLNHVVLDNEQKFITIMETGVGNKYNDSAYRVWTKQRSAPSSYIHQLNETLQLLNRRELLPALVFVFSIQMCETYAAAMTASYIDSRTSAEIAQIVNYHIRGKQRADLEKNPQFHMITKFLAAGIAVHHSGLHPKLKEIVELLFSRGMVRVLFCTETFSVGINMPTRTVVFVDYKKPDDESSGHRFMFPDEYMQMAGRAGRRGKDTSGLVLYLPSREPAAPEHVKSMMTGSCASLESQMVFDYDFLLKSLQAGESVSWRTIMTNSYWYEQKSEEMAELEARALVLKTAITTAESSLDAVTLAALNERETLELAFKQATPQGKKDAQRARDKWQNTHVGPKWDAAQKIKRTIDIQKKELLAVQENIEKRTIEYSKPVTDAVEFLMGVGFMCADAATIDVEKLTAAHLTDKGIMATEINEGHEILMTELYASSRTIPLSDIEIVATLAAFITERASDESPTITDLDVPDRVKDVLWWIGDLAADAAEHSQQPSDYWKLSTVWIEPLYRWTQGEEMCILCEQYGIQAGTFIRTVLKMANMMEEWTRLATYKSDTDMLDKTKNIQLKLVRDAVRPDSLYLTL